MKRKRRNILIAAAKLAIVLAAFAYLLFSGHLKPGDMRLASGRYHLVALAVGALVLMRLVSFLRHWVLLQTAGIHIGLWEVSRIGMIGFFFGSFLGGAIGGDVIRTGYLLKRAKDNRSGALASIMVDRGCGVLGLIALGGVALAWAGQQVVSSAILQGLALFIIGTLGGSALAAVTATSAMVRSWKTGAAVWLAINVAGAGCLFAWSRSAGGQGWPAVGLHPFHARLFQLLIVVDLVGLAAVPIGRSLAGDSAFGRWVRDRVPLGGKLFKLIDALKVYQRRLARLRAAFAMSIVIHMLTIFALFLFAAALSLETHPKFVEVFLAGPPALLTSTVPLPGGGLGVSEAVFDRILAGAGGERVVLGGAAVFLMTRCWNILLGLLGLPLYLITRTEISSLVHQDQPVGESPADTARACTTSQPTSDASGCEPTSQSR